MIISQRDYGVIDILRIPLQCAPILSCIIGIHTLLSGLAATLQVIATSYFINTAISIVQDGAPMRSIYPSMLAVTGLVAYMWVSNELIKFAHVRLEIAVREKFRTAIAEKTARLAYRHIETPATWDLISRVSNNPESRVQDAFVRLMNLSALAVRIIGVLTLLFAYIWWAAILILVVAVPLFVLSVKSGKAVYQSQRETSEYKRRVDYLTEVLTGRESADERVLFGFGPQLNDIWSEQYETARKMEYQSEKKWYIRMKLSSILSSVISMIVILILLSPAIHGTLSIGLFITLVTAVIQISSNMSWTYTRNVEELTKFMEYLKDIATFSKLEETTGVTALPASPPPSFHTLEFRNVRFAYPGTSKVILDGLSFRMEAGWHYAFVGVNGAGKTTIMKLAMGLYDQFEGEILLNGKSIKEYSPSELKAFYSVVYQDFARYSISLRHNIALGDVNSMAAGQHEPRIRQAVQQAHLLEVERNLPNGLDTPLGKIKDDGQDLSGGEWQRVAIARALVNPAPVRILDEPTAALDPLSESRLYEDFERTSANKTTILISHRLGSTKLADHIFVIDSGRVIEEGSHQELMSFRGVYAEMYESQRSWYDDGGR
jgi:ATP-binding cassette subfamily B protein